ncbi:MAG TPA: RNA polymerase sigma factor [Polyangiaceae bacterium]
MSVERSPNPHQEQSEQTAEFRRVVDDHVSFLWRALRHLGVRERDLEDVCQDVFLVAHRRMADFRGDSTLRTWLYGIAVRLASEHRRRAQVRREIPTSEPPLDAAVDRGDEVQADQQLERHELRHRLHRILEQLDEDKRAVFVLYEIEDLDMKEVAKAVGCPLQTAYSRLHAARRFVADAVREQASDHLPTKATDRKAGSNVA